jgi:hypothetical protein
MRDLSALQQDSGPASVRLQRFSEAIVSDLSTWLRLLPVAYEFLGLIFRNKTVQKAFRRYLRTYVSLTVPIIRDGIESGEFRAADPTETALTLGALFEGTLLLWVYDPEAVEVEKQILSGVHLLLEGLKA